MTVKGDNMSSIRRNNRSAVLDALLATGGTSRKHLAERLNLTPAAITHITAELLSEGLVREGASLVSTGAGRREVILEIVPESGVALGVLLNLREATVSATYLDGTVIFSENVPLPMNAPADETVEMLAKKLETMLRSNRISPSSLIGLGLAVRGIPCGDKRTIRDSYGALSEKNYPIAEKFEALLHIPAKLANNVRALFSAEMFLRRGVSDAEFFLRCEYGIGASIATNGCIYHGVTEQSAEIGHIRIVPKGGKLCSCGKRGCLETVASPNAIKADVAEIYSETATPVLFQLADGKPADEITIEEIMQAAEKNDKAVRRITDRALNELAGVLSSVVYLLDPGRVTFYGRMFENEYCLSSLCNELSKRSDGKHHVEYRKSEFNRTLENRCAPLLAVNAFYRQGGYRK